MIVIRLSRVGKKKQPTYRIVVQEKQRDPWGTSLEILGHYNPRTKPKTVSLKEERVRHWLAQGARPTPTVHNLLVDAKLIEGSKVKATQGEQKKRQEAARKKAEEAPKEAAVAAEAPSAEDAPTETS
ncbi:hypothetical protein AMJ57_00650 [Parcubacteria bacterium SG8_24]|nr:MAG: hypothetical protein AMJ57_00650 [Parcubacteria bacterium SG8_24]